jgi:hypothetical protein
VSGPFGTFDGDEPLAHRFAGQWAVVSMALRKALAALRKAPAQSGWIALGFVAGMLFWHVVGFWTFMSRVVFDGPETAAVTIQQAKPVYAHLETGALQRIGKLASRGGIEAACTVVVRDLPNGTTRQAPCPILSKPLKQRTQQARGDLAPRQIAKVVAPSDWAIELAPLKDIPLNLP